MASRKEPIPKILPTDLQGLGPSTLLRAHLVRSILTGKLRVGDRLPTVRQLSKDWNLNRNTVSAVYRTLERAGYLETARGKGTVVTSGKSAHVERLRDPISRFDDIVREGLASGMSREEIFLLAVGGKEEPERESSPARFAFVECNEEDLGQYRFELEKELKVPVVPILLSDLRAKGMRRVPRGIEMVLTTFPHLYEVRSVLGSSRVRILGLLAGNRIEEILDPGRIPRGTRIAVVCVTREKARLLGNKVKRGFGRMREIAVLAAEEVSDLAERLKAYDLIVLSPYAARSIRGAIPRDRELLVCSNLVDQEGLEMLRRIV